MSAKPKALLAWSSGKDSAWTLHVLREQGHVEVVGLLTTINGAFDRVAMHAAVTELLRARRPSVALTLALAGADPLAVSATRRYEGGDGGGDGAARAPTASDRVGVRRSLPRGRCVVYRRGAPGGPIGVDAALSHLGHLSDRRRWRGGWSTLGLARAP